MIKWVGLRSVPRFVAVQLPVAGVVEGETSSSSARGYERPGGAPGASPETLDCRGMLLKFPNVNEPRAIPPIKENVATARTKYTVPSVENRLMEVAPGMSSSARAIFNASSTHASAARPHGIDRTRFVGGPTPYPCRVERAFGRSRRTGARCMSPAPEGPARSDETGSSDP